MRRLRWTGAMLLFGAGLAACGSGAGSPTASPQPAESSAPSAPTAGGVVVPAALDFQAPTVGGGQFDARAYVGQPLALWFWAPY